jgi:predicted ferric reductase
MNMLKNKGNIIITSILINNLLFWIISKYYYIDFFTSNWKYFSKAASLTSTLMMAIVLILTTKLSFLEYLFGGLDKVYKAHHTLARWSFTLILLHPVFLALIGSESFTDFLKYFVPNFENQYNIGHAIGILCTLIYFVLLYITISKKINYELWQASHSWFGTLFALIIAHILFVNGDINKYTAFSWWYNSWLILGLLAYIWTTFLSNYFGTQYKYVIDYLEKVGPFYELELKPVDKIMSYKPGQFVYTQFINCNLPIEWHPYSIAFYDTNGLIKLGIKELGDYTKQLDVLNIRDIVNIKGPHGSLSEKVIIKPQREVVLIAGGVGVTPMISIWEYILQNKRAKTTMVYISSFIDQATFDNDFKKLDNKYGIGDNDYWLYLDEGKNFINVDMIKNRVGGLENKIFIICGPKRMMDMMVKGLKVNGVKNMDIVIEDFDMGIGSNQWFSHITKLLTK